MAATAESFWTEIPRVKRAERVAMAPPRVSFDGPVLIGDCAAAWGERPMLLLVLDRWAEGEEN